MRRYVVAHAAESHSGLRCPAIRVTACVMLSTVLSLLMLAAVLLGVGGIYLILRKKDYKRGWLMIAAAVVMLTNVAIMTAPLD